MTAIQTKLGGRDQALNTIFGRTATIPETNVQRAIEYVMGVVVALPVPPPSDADYIVGTANAGLSAERVATDTATVNVDLATPGQALWHVLEVPGIDAAGLVARTGAANYEARTLTAPAAGITVTNGDGVAGNPTLVLANDLAALEGLGSTGFATRSAADTWLQRAMTGTANEITVTNGDGVAGAPVFSIPTAVTFTGKTITGGTFSTPTLTAPVLNGVVTTTGLTLPAFTLGGTITSNGQSFSGTIANLGTVTTADINGGTIDGAVIGGASAANGTFTTLTVNTNANPDANDGAGLGTGALGWSDLFLASGGVVNWDNGNVTLTHAAGEVRISGPAQTVLAISPVGNGGIEIGRIDGTLSTPFLDFHSGATAVDYDSRILASGGSGSDGGGTLNIIAASIQLNGVPIFSNLPQNSQSTAYTTVLADAQKHILHPTADNNARTFTIAANASVAYPIGTAITFVNQINVVTIAINSDTLVLAGAGTTGSRSLAANGMATALKIASTTWMISGTGLT